MTISATALSLRSTIVLCGTAIGLATGLALFHLPLITQDGGVLELPGIFIFGIWIALVIAIVFSTAYSRRVTTEIHSMADALAATQMALAREQKLTDLGGVVAAAAHELGTPLATIKLASSELWNELQDQPDLAEDAALIRDQADRCRDILRDMGRAGKDDLHLRQAPLMTVLEEAAEPHRMRGKSFTFTLGPDAGDAADQPAILRRPEVIHGLRNLMQNAVDFAATTVWVEANWSETVISVRIFDDGTGFPPHILGRIGDPFMRRRPSDRSNARRPEYEGMGLGLFIAKTLLERSGAELRFANGPDSAPKTDTPVGAVVKVTWPREKLDAHHGETPLPTGENTRFT